MWNKIKVKRGGGIARNKTKQSHKYIPDKLVGQFITSHETGRRSYFDKSWRTIESSRSEMERKFISLLSNYTALVLAIRPWQEQEVW